MKKDKQQTKYFSVTCYFKVLDSEMFGGKGSTGYTSVSLGFENQMNGNPQDVVEITRENSAQMMKVDLDKVISISFSEYEENTEDD
ncbi:MAG TPA: hypothetical protein GX707_20885 [Epulopiscium sp.]|nr:hypothetical protein [Candidatus Epulonipiscium sp.]